MNDQSYFDGSTIHADSGAKYRLTGQLDRVREFMKDGQWHTLDDLILMCGGTGPSVSARLRDLRKARFGGHTIIRQHLRDGLWVYRMEVPECQ